MSDVTTSKISARKLRANRRNAKKSTGPRTEEGKAIASRNAVLHGLYCAKDFLLPGESTAQFLLLRQSYIISLLPVDQMELTLVERIAMSQWKIKRLHSVQHQLHITQMQRIKMTALNEIDKVRSGTRKREYYFDPQTRTYQEEEPPPWHRPLPPKQAIRGKKILIEALGAGPMSVGIVRSHEFTDKLDLDRFDRLDHHEHRMENAMDKALRELHRLRKTRQKNKGEEEPNPYDCPYLEDMEVIHQMLEAEQAKQRQQDEEDDEDDDEVDNEQEQEQDDYEEEEQDEDEDQEADETQNMKNEPTEVASRANSSEGNDLGDNLSACSRTSSTMQEGGREE